MRQETTGKLDGWVLEWRQQSKDVIERILRAPSPSASSLEEIFDFSAEQKYCRIHAWNPPGLQGAFNIVELCNLSQIDKAKVEEARDVLNARNLKLVI